MPAIHAAIQFAFAAGESLVFAELLAHDPRKERCGMKMIRAILRPEAAETITKELADSGFVSMTQIHVFGRGKQKGITIGAVRYEELPKTMLMMVVEDRNVSDAVQLIKDGAYTGNYGDGKVFISPIEDAITIRTGTHGL